MTVRILRGDCREVLKTLPDESVHCVVTSPPYWGLRDYGTAKWEGGADDCAHRVPATGSTQNKGNNNREGSPFRDECGTCGASRIDSQLGLEPTPQEYVERMVEVFREVRRVLRADGTCWLNLGDSYAQSEVRHRNGSTGTMGQPDSDWNAATYQIGRKLIHGLKQKDLCGIPWRVAFALQADGWWLRQDIIWHKPNPMPESVTDRCTKAHEYIFLLAKSERYYYDAAAIAEAAADTFGTMRMSSRRAVAMGLMPSGNEIDPALGERPNERNKRSVWTVTTKAFSEAHFATFPPDLIEPCILAGTSERGCCAKCGAPWERQQEDSQEYAAFKAAERERKNGGMRSSNLETLGLTVGTSNKSVRAERVTTGWSPSCGCAFGTTPCTVLDPFGGAGTTGLVADRLQRSAILIELNPEYASMAERRIVDDAPLFAEVMA